MNVVQWAANNWPKDISRTGVESEMEKRARARGGKTKEGRVLRI